MDYSNSGSREVPYCRKQKSLGLLSTNFVSLYNREGVDTIGLDDAANRLGVERRRIYDIVNVFESMGILTKKAKNMYTWKGFKAVPKTLENLKNEGFRENIPASDTSCSEKVSDDEEDMYSDMNNLSQNDKSDSNSVAKSSGQRKVGDSRKEKSLALLTQNFVKLFLCTDMDLISLDTAAKLLLGDGKCTSTTSRTKVRRLYDIANVLSSMNFIEKIPHPETRKPSFRWLGLNGKPDNKPFEGSESKKRVFGTDLSNFAAMKRAKVYENSHQLLMPCLATGIKQEFSENEVERTRAAKSHMFGPFTPLIVPKNGASNDEKAKQAVDLESLAARPQHHTEAVKDLFVHFVEAWRSWYSESVCKNTV